LHTRIGLLAAGLALTAIALLSVLANEYQRSTSITWAQRLNYELAKYIIEHQAQPLLQNDGTADMAVLKDLAMDIMMVNPSVELYLLNIDGRVLGHALDNAIIANPTNSSFFEIEIDWFFESNLGRRSTNTGSQRGVLGSRN
jgi:hypothetical protein